MGLQMNHLSGQYEVRLVHFEIQNEKITIKIEAKNFSLCIFYILTYI
jgi:hypothetical protein